MPRRPRNEHAGAIYHVFARGVNRVRVFVDDADYQRYTDMLATTVRYRGWNCMSYCLMPNHVHLLIETPEPNLGDGMHWLHGLYAQTFNQRHERVGHLFQDRYRSEPIEDQRQFVTIVGYIALNPVAATLRARPEDWPWSSHAGVSAGAPQAWIAHERLLEYLEAAAGCRCYAELIETRARLTTDATLK